MLEMTLELEECIGTAFPSTRTPPSQFILRHGAECADCVWLASELDQYSRLPIGEEGLALLASNQHHLTHAGWVWFASNFLRIVIEEVQPTRIEIQSLVFFFVPRDRPPDQLVEVLSRLTVPQIGALLKFFKWLGEHQFWEDYLGDDIPAAISTLESELKRRPK